MSLPNTFNSPQALYTESHPITVQHLVIEHKLSIAISVDQPEQLTQHSKLYSKAKQTKSFVSENLRIRYYIRFSASQGQWLLDFASVPLGGEDDMDKATALSVEAVDFRIALRFCNPPFSVGDLFKWPTGGSHMAVFRCLGDGSMVQIRKGDSSIVKKKFFRMGLPTIGEGSWAPWVSINIGIAERIYGDQYSPKLLSDELPSRPVLDSGMTTMGPSYSHSPSAPMLKSKGSLASFLEFVGVAPRTEQLMPKKPTETPRVAVVHDSSQNMPENEQPESVSPFFLKRRTKSWSGKAGHALKDTVEEITDQDPRGELLQKYSGPIAEGTDSTSLLSKKLGFRYTGPFLTWRNNNQDKEKERTKLRPSPLVRSISACDIQSPTMSEQETEKQNDANKLKRSSTDHKMVRFAGDTITADEPPGQTVGIISRTPAPPVLGLPNDSPTPSSSPMKMRFQEDNLVTPPRRRVIQQATEIRGFSPGASSFHDSQLTLVSSGLRNGTDGNGDTPRRPLSPVSPPDPEYIAQVERNIELDIERNIADARYAATIPFPHRPRAGVALVFDEEDDEEEEDVDVSQLTEEQIYSKKVGKLRNWVHYPPRQIAVEFMPKSRAHWDWRPKELREQFNVFAAMDLDDDLAGSVSAIRYPSTF